MIDGEALGGRLANPDSSWHIIPGFPETGRRGLLNQHFNQYTNLVKGSAACSWANAPLKWQERPVPGNHLRRIFYGVPRASSLLPCQMSRVSVNCLALGSTWTRLIEITQKPDEESLSINCCGMFEDGCPGRANGSADQPEEGVAEDRCAFIRALAAVNVARLKGERLMGSAQRVEVRGSGWTRQGEQVTLQAEGMRARLPPLWLNSTVGGGISFIKTWAPQDGILRSAISTEWRCQTTTECILGDYKHSTLNFSNCY